MWFTETAWPPVALCLIVAAFLAAQTFTSRRAVFAGGSVLLVLACIPIFLIERSIVTEAEIIDAAVDDMVQAVYEGDSERCLAHISKQASDPTFNSIATKVYLAVEVLEIEELPRITDRSVELRAEGSRAIAHFRVNGRGSAKFIDGSQGEFRTRWRLTWQKEAGEWKVIKIVQLNAMTGKPVPIGLGGL